MTSDAEQLIRAYYGAFNSQDWDAFFALLAEDVVHDLNQGSHETGKPAFRRFISSE